MKDPRKNRILSCLLIAVATAIVSLVPVSIMAHPGAGIAIDRQGQVYFLDTGSGLWKIDTQGKVSHLSETRFHWLALDENNLFASGRLPSSAGTGLDWEILKVAANPTVLIASDWPIALSQDGSLYYQSGHPGNLRIMRALPSGVTSVLATLPPTTSGQPLPYVSGLATGASGSLYYTENNAIRRITARGVIGIVVTVPPSVNGPSIPATDMHPYLRGLAVDADGVMYVADTGDARVLKITPRGEITTLVQTESPWSPTAVALFRSDVYVLEFLHTVRDVRRDWLPRIRKITPDGKSKIILTVDQMPGAR
jgi:hypothetical protein